jgi:hypothetical protein
LGIARPVEGAAGVFGFISDSSNSPPKRSELKAWENLRPVMPARRQILACKVARRDDIAALAPRPREQNKAELLAATGRDALTALTARFANSKRCWTMLHRGKIIAMFGVSHVRNQRSYGRIWMLGSDDLFRQGRVLLRDGPIWLREMMHGHTVLCNFIDARNESYVRWLKRLGFRFVQLHAKFGLAKQPFWEFLIRPADFNAAMQSYRGKS